MATTTQYKNPDSSYMRNGNSQSHHSPIINYRKDAKKAVKFTFMVVGESGTGKTTFINSLLNKKVLNHRYENDFTRTAANGETKTLTFTSANSVALPNTSMLTRNEFNANTIHEEPGIALTETKVEIIDDDNLKLILNIIDTPGFGENLNNELCFIEIENYLKQQFDLVLAEETRIKRNPRFTDTRVHVMLYFITPTGHGLREIDVQCMKRLSKYVNIIPIIGKADSFTPKELQYFKQQVKNDIEKFNVPVFQFDNFLDEYDEEEDYDLIQECKFYANLQPFAIITSEETFEVKDKKTGAFKIIKARNYPWGLVDINDTSVSDFPYLKSVLLGSHLQDLKDLTHDFLYETYRTERLTNVTGGGVGLDDEEYDEDNEFHDTVEHHQNEDKGNGALANSTIPSLSNLAQLTNTPLLSNNNNHGGSNFYDQDSRRSSSSSIKKSSSMLLDDDHSSASLSKHGATSTANNHTHKSSYDFTPNTSSISINERAPNNDAFKRLSIGPQRNQLRQISETVPYVIRHERNIERQNKLEEMEKASAKELATRAALLEKKAQELKLKERALMKQLELAKQKSLSSAASSPSIRRSNSNVEIINDDEEPGNGIQGRSYQQQGNGHSTSVNEGGSGLQKDETLTDIHSIVSEKTHQPHHQQQQAQAHQHQQSQYNQNEYYHPR
ncbi:uncharacterized protein KGF55_005213 [Candida pseudojiufengensis]|uniref:uncharacterized protein n=1 Tax=Candida pseudojiufengensis TaxID=497109 RepID=UPI0022251C20|nr:uncharacterized protein KGF55_005213 [Candida pseudojiufengensis]KAI5959569.1 hypothetical protein KGF55_005213 [Candida pseudojiufengensis]